MAQTLAALAATVGPILVLVGVPCVILNRRPREDES